ncbi:hypothetical protein [Brachybacterium sp. UNK5269]|uniref:hypothetical protein n=1 Tax=Brachybacterium sp. UNK5269 TaxID=3408576 RepID=UPI003BB05745
MPRDSGRFAGALLHRSQWLAAGFHPRDLASDRFTTVFPGYHTLTVHPATVNAMAWVLQNRVQRGSVLSHTTAALLWGVPLPWRLEDGVGLLRRPDLPTREGVPLIPAVLPDRSLAAGAKLPMLHCRVERGGSAGVSRGAVVHRCRGGEIARVGGLIVSSPGDTLRELATLMPLWDVVAAIEAVVGPQTTTARTTLPALSEVIAEAHRRAGAPRLRAALDLARMSVRSPGETVMRLLLDAVGFPSATPNLPVRDPVSNQLREIDLAWEAVGLGLEYDGEGHRLTKEQWREDEARREELASYGWTLVRANGDDLWRPLRLLLRLRRTAQRHGLAVPSEERIREGLRDVARRQLSLRIRGPRP